MKLGLILAGALAAAACDRRPVAPADRPAEVPRRAAAPSALVARLAADRAALEAARATCRAQAAQATPELCAAVAEATRRRFLGKTQPYAPAPVDAVSEGG
ncbi:MAG: hypothetical protein Q8Q88_06405 [Phenylobacterium sp.]|uniref:hypothetical protein n=1 Tax=Phenylobacterium sp. TaxID=1871053 RepID=UPI0027365B6C|nr:hypothetical protein [Phenylobacterium sp.]MDP3746666.1 hypothetical protein [Phenylobacterium sp.]